MHGYLSLRPGHHARGGGGSILITGGIEILGIQGCAGGHPPHNAAGALAPQVAVRIGIDKGHPSVGTHQAHRAARAPVTLGRSGGEGILNSHTGVGIHNANQRAYEVALEVAGYILLGGELSNQGIRQIHLAAHQLCVLPHGLANQRAGALRRAGGPGIGENHVADGGAVEGIKQARAAAVAGGIQVELLDGVGLALPVFAGEGF